MISLKNLLERGNKGDLSFIKSLKHFDSDEMLKYYQDELEKKLRETSSAHWDIALTIATFVRSGAWVAYHAPTMKLQDQWHKEHPDRKCSENPYHSPGGNDYWCSSISFLTFMKVNFGLCKTSVYNYLKVVDTFATYIEERGKEPEYRINAEAKFYQFWQLIEMTSLTYQERKVIEPNWTRQQIRDYKKSLRDKYKVDKVQPAEQEVEPEEVPLTEAQERYKKFTRNDLINTVVELEDRNAALEKEKAAMRERMQMLEKSASGVGPFNQDNRTEAKRDITALIESFVKAFDYNITLCGRKQGAKVFAGNIAEKILLKYIDGKSPGNPEIKKARKEVKCEQISIIS